MKTDLQTFIELMERCGHKYEIFERVKHNFCLKGKIIFAPILEIVVQGCFYDELYVYFNPNDHSLLEMQSHVSFNDSTTQKLKQYLLEYGEYK